MKRILFVVTLALPLVVGASFAADFNGDGTGDIAIFRASSGLWSVRGITRVYFGGTGDNPVPGDYDGSGTDSLTIFRASSGLWAARGVTRVYFGGSSDEPKAGDYNGDGTENFGIFRGTSGLWAVRGITRVYYGISGDVAIAAGKVRGAGSVAGLPPTGQSTCVLLGDDGFYQAGAPFQYSGMAAFPSFDYVVMDRKTDLMWAGYGDKEGCNWGQATDWESAIWFCTHLVFAGFTDWRLPNVKELESIVDYSQIDPSIDTTYFTCCAALTESYWSSTSYAGNTENFAWRVGFWAGSSSYVNKDSSFYVRAVRGGL